MKVALVTVDYNNHKDTYELLDSYKNINTKNIETKFIVVDNGSKKPLQKQKLEKYNNTLLVRTTKNFGFAGGYNRGMRWAVAWGADYVFIINNDTCFKNKNILLHLIKVLEENKKAGLVSPKILFAPGYEFHKDRYKETERGRVIWYAGGDFDWQNVYSQHRGIDETDKGQFDEIARTGFISGCCLMIKSEVLQKVGYFDERLFAYFEDNDFVNRVEKSGFKQYYDGKVTIYHKVSQTAGIGSAFTDYLLTRNRLYIGMKYAPIRTKLALMREALKFLLTGRKAQKQGVLDFFRGKFGPPPSASQKPDYDNLPIDTSVVVVNYKTTDLTVKLLQSIYKDESFDKSKDEIIILDNASEDSLPQRIKKYKDVLFVQSQVNLGFAGGYNRAIELSRGKNILMLNSDIELKKGFFKKLKKASQKYENAILVPKLILPDASTQKSVFNLPSIANAVKEYLLGIKNAYSMYNPNASKPVKVEGAVMAAMFIPRKVWDRVGRISEKSFMYYEDIEYCRRLKKNNIPIYYLPNLDVKHHHGASSKKIGNKANEYLVNGAKAYHGIIKFYLITLVIKIGQKLHVVSKNKKR